MQGDLDGAIEDFSRSLDLDQTHDMAWVNRGIAFSQKGDLTASVADWERFLELAPNHPDAAAVYAEIQKLRRRLSKPRVDSDAR